MTTIGIQGQWHAGCTSGTLFGISEVPGARWSRPAAAGGAGAGYRGGNGVVARIAAKKSGPAGHVTG